MRDIHTLINTLITLLANEQQKNGGFLSISSQSTEFVSPQATHATIFYPALILLSLERCKKDQAATSIIDAGIDFLLSQKSDRWSFNYWDRTAPTYTSEPYPDDLDDTALAIAACTIHKKEVIDGAVLAHLVTQLTALEQQPGGPYSTWLVAPDAPDAWRDVDVAVNSNIHFLLSLHEVTLPNIDAFIDSVIHSKQISSPYYYSSYPLLYFIARHYRGKEQDRLIEHILATKTQEHTWENPLATALMISSLLALGVEKKVIAPSMETLLATSESELTKPYPFVIEKIMDGVPLYSGSAAWTIAACIEALTAYSTDNSSSTYIPAATETVVGSDIYNSIISNITKRCDDLDVDLQKQSKHLLQRMVERDANKQIGLLPYFTWQSLQAKNATVPTEFLTTLGMVNMYGWMAYRVYDDFFDDEGTVPLLSVANVCLRECVSIYSALFTSTEEKKLFTQLMDRIDAANTWETMHCRAKKEDSKLTIRKLPGYGNYLRLADRSIGHALGPIAVLIHRGISADSEEVEHMLAFFEHYIIARQLNDDMHDWQEDIQKGHINSVGAALLTVWQEKNSLTLPYSIDLTNDLAILQELFWYDVVTQFVTKCEIQLAQAKESIRRIPHIHEYSYFDSLLSPLERSTIAVKKEQKEMIAFLSAYTTSQQLQ